MTINLFGREVELRTKIVFTPPERQEVSEYGISRIGEILRDTLKKRGFAPDNPVYWINYALGDGWDWAWLVQKGEHRGKLPTRISAKLKKERGIELPASVIEKIGSVAKNHLSAQSRDYTFDFTPIFDWEAGQFGDEGSCYWGSNKIAKSVLKTHGGMAIRFYEEADNRHVGIGRAWIIPDCPDKGDALLYNGYGKNALDGDALVVITNVLSAYFGVQYKKISVRNNGTSRGKVWINGDRGFVLSEGRRVSSVPDLFDFGWDVDHVKCDKCVAIKHASELFYSDHQAMMCLSCFGETNRVHCSARGCRTNIMARAAQRGLDHEVYCRTHWTELFCTCEECGQTIERYERQLVGDGRTVCRSCIEALYPRCDGCSRRYRRSEMTEVVEHEYLCVECLESSVRSVPCRHCGLRRSHRRMVFIEDQEYEGWYCESSCRHHPLAAMNTRDFDMDENDDSAWEEEADPYEAYLLHDFFLDGEIFE